MNNNLVRIRHNYLVDANTLNEVLKYNSTTSLYGLSLTQTQAKEIILRQGFEVRNNGRVEFGRGIIGKIITAFCDSPYLNQNNYSDTLCELIELFYYFKNETQDILDDDELIDYMKTFFNGSCCGSIELLASRELEQLARDIRTNYSAKAQDGTF